MRLALVPISLFAALSATAAPAATRDWPATGFDQVELRSAAEVTIRAGPGFAVHADGDPRLVERLTVDVRRGVLVLGWRDGQSVSTRGGRLHISITMPRTTGVTIGGAGTITVERGAGPDFRANVGGAGTIRVASVRAERTTLTMSGAGEIVVAGNTGGLDARASGVGTIDAGALPARAGRVTVSGTGHIRARIDGPVDVSLSGIGDVAINGHPRCTVHKSGLGSVRCG